MNFKVKILNIFNINKYFYMPSINRSSSINMIFIISQRNILIFITINTLFNLLYKYIISCYLYKIKVFIRHS